MLKSLSFALLLVVLPIPAQAIHVCYMEWGERTLELNSLCENIVDEASATDIFQTNLPVPQADVWTTSAHFNKPLLDFGSIGLDTPIIGNLIFGNIYNSSDKPVQDVIIEATGYANGEPPQIRRAFIHRILPNESAPAQIVFDFHPSHVDRWDVRVIAWK